MQTPPRFAFSAAFDVLCKITGRESRGITLIHEPAELVKVPKIAVRTLSGV